MKLHKNHELSTFSLHVFLLCTSVILNFESTDVKKKIYDIFISDCIQPITVHRYIKVPIQVTVY